MRRFCLAHWKHLGGLPSGPCLPPEREDGVLDCRYLPARAGRIAFDGAQVHPLPGTLVEGELRGTLELLPGQDGRGTRAVLHVPLVVTAER